MKALVAGFVTIDTIHLPVRTITSVGGPPSYAGLICSRLGVDTFALTRIGTDFPEDQFVWLARNGISLRASDRSLVSRTTRFDIEESQKGRKLTLTARCDDIAVGQLPETQFNASLVSPVANEVSPSLLSEVAKHSDFTFLDPQGFVRSFNDKGEVTMAKLRNPGLLSKVDAMKMDEAEADAVTGRDRPDEALRKLASMGLRKAVITRGAQPAFVLDGTRIFTVPVPSVQVVDTTGAGDILGGTIVAWYLKTRDFLWSACFGVAASSLSLHMIALAKVDLPITVDEQARRLYSLATPVVSV